MTKIDFTKQYKQLYQPKPKIFTVVEVPTFSFLMVDGHGDPNHSPEYQHALEALYAVAYRLKFISKQELARDYVVPPLEGLWWAADMATFTTARDKSQWDWTMMIMLPEWIRATTYERALDEVAAKKGKDLPSLPKVRNELYSEGLAVQTLHIGSYDDEGPVLAQLHNEWLPAHGYTFNGKHHEIYQSDARRVAPEKLKTVLRQPIRGR